MFSQYTTTTLEMNDPYGYSPSVALSIPSLLNTDEQCLPGAAHGYIGGGGDYIVFGNFFEKPCEILNDLSSA